MPQLAKALAATVDGLSGRELAQILQIAPRSADRRLAAARAGSSHSWRIPELSRLAAWEQRVRGTQVLAEALLHPVTAPTHTPADSLGTAAVAPGIAQQLSSLSALLARISTVCADGHLDHHEAREVLTLIDHTLADGAQVQDKLRQLRDRLRTLLLPKS